MTDFVTRGEGLRSTPGSLPSLARTDRHMLARVALDLLASYGHDRECDHYRIGEDIVDHFGLDLYSSELGFHDGEGRTLLKLAQGFTDAEMTHA